MKTSWFRPVLMLGLPLLLLGSPQVQAAGQQDAMSILNALPPELHAKVQALALMLDQDIKSGKLTEAEVRQGMLSGHLGERLKTIHPEAGLLLDEISDASKHGNGPGEESLMPLLGGLGIAGGN